MSTLLEAKTAIVTGAAGGIGRATALRFAKEGARVLAVDRAEAGLEETVTLGGGASGALRALVCDVTAGDAPQRILAACKEAYGAPELLINNAGIGGAHPVLETGDAEWERFLGTNLSSLFRISRAVVPEIQALGGGRIINIASIYGMVGFPGSSSYSVAKAGVIALTRQMAADYGPSGIRVNAIAPGLIETAMTAERIRSNAWFRESMLTATPLGRVGRPEDIAGAALFLCSPDADFIAGQVLVVDGGWLATRYRPPREG
jgi:NAD(P)-dependent dehydrogenase (short-subunit alcohol dehydrogenase family)